MNQPPKLLLAKALGALILALASLAILSHALTVSANREAPGQQPLPLQDKKGVQAPMQPFRPVAVATVNFGELARAEKKRGPSAIKSEAEPVEIHPPMTIPEPDVPLISSELTKPSLEVPQPADAGGSLIGSPAPAASFVAQLDEPKVGSSSRTIPPDTTGAVGRTKIFSTLNSNYRIQNKADGATLSTVSIDSFWSPLNTPTPAPPLANVSGVFDPRVQYDPYNDRWILAAVSNSRTASASVLVGISTSSDPEGTFTLYRFVVGCEAGAADCHANGEWGDFPMLGFNKNWIAVGWNQFRTSGTGGFVAGKMLILDYPALLSGTATSNISTVSTGANFCMHPATTYSATEEALYVPVHVSSAGAAYQLHRINKKVDGSPEFVIDGVNKVRPGGGWIQPGGDILPQTCVGTLGATCPGSLRFIDSGDSFLRSNAVFRSGNIWYSQTVGLPAPAGGALTHTSAQWTRIDTSGNFVEGGRIDDPNATPTNGEWYAYPSIAVNANGDVLLGLSNFGARHFARAAYAMRLNGESSMRDAAMIKEGEDYYSKSFSGTRNRWGDYSHTMVDPDNDLDFWTIQEYASARVPAVPADLVQTTTNASRWGTWWAKITPGAPPADPLPTPAPCATTMVVNDAGDAGDAVPGDGFCATAGGVCTLRAALDEANARVYCGTISITFSVTGQITLASGGLVVAHDVNITGPGSAQLLVRRSPTAGTPNFRIIEVRGAPTMAISGLTLAGGNLSGAGGGIFFSSGVLSLTDVTISGNTATDAGRGGGLYVNSGTVTLSSSVVSGNSVTSAGSGGGIYVNSGVVTLTNSSLTGNTAASGMGGGILNQGTLTINGCTISNNSTHDGGGIFNGAGSLTVANSTISNNASAGAGGGIQQSGSTSTAFYLIGSTIANNTSSTSGGGIAIGSLAGTVGLVINSTISGNTARENGGGVLLSNAPGFTLNFVNSTITANRANLNGNTGIHGGGISRFAGIARLRNTIVSGNLNGTGNTPDDINAAAVDSSSSFNLVGTCNSCGLSNGINSNRVGVTNPLLGGLANNGGPTLTHALLSCSPALNAGSNALALDQNNTPLLTDQRGAGFNRISNGTVDIGAFELPAAAPAILVEQGNDLAAVDSVTLARGPFALTNNHNFSADKRTRILFYVTDLGFAQLTQPDINTLSVQIGGNPYAVEAVGPNAATCGSYVVFRLPDLPASPNPYQLGIRVRSVNSTNTPNFTIVSSPSGPAAAANSKQTKLMKYLLFPIVDLLL